ncbi:MAG: type II toxin-antitoxin system VapC family toxin [Tepidisphaeraceae bacterium]|jgi:tRNA(fMet)-specific endonuclease VapC
MKWVLDTNACIRYLNGRAPKLKQHIDATDPADIRVCSVVKAELFFGAARSTDPAGTLQRQKHFLARFTSLVFDDAAAEIYGGIRAQLQALGTPIGPNDLLIASISIANGVTLVTHNVNEFSRVTGLSIEDWEV